MKNLKTLYFNRVNGHNIVVFNLLLWVFSFIILLFLFSSNTTPDKVDYIYTGNFLATIIIPVSINLYLLIPFFLKKEKYLLFILCFVVNILFFSQLNVWFFNSFIDTLFPNYYFVSYHSNTKLIFIFSTFIIISMLVKLSEDWLYLNKTENNFLRLKNKQIETQLTSLRAQINPHFLFNSLNVIYSLALKNNQKTTDAIVQLSDILRYVIYDTETSKITLEKEIDLLKKYIQFQKFRYDKIIEVTFSETITAKGFTIYPMLLLPLLENSYKYGIHPSFKSPFINITLTKTKKEFHFFIENQFSSEKSIEKKESFGLGIKNIQQNLELMYPKQHQLSFQKNNDIFTVSLKIFDDN